MTGLSQDQVIRYSRQLLIFNHKQQEKLLNSKVLVIGAGGLGSPASIYLAAAGIGTIGIVDPDKVELSNLHRQIIHSTKGLGKLKVDSALEMLGDLNSDVRIVKHAYRLDKENAEIIKEYDVVVDGSDNFPTRYLVNDTCIKYKKPDVYGSVLGYIGRASIFIPGGPCYRCMHPKPPLPGAIPSCAEAGVLGVVPGLIGMIQATETIKYILQIGLSLKSKILLYDAQNMSFKKIRIYRNPNCIC